MARGSSATAASPVSDTLSVGTGDAQQMYAAVNASVLAVRKGTAASPDTLPQPLVKVERLIQIPEASVTGDGVEQCSAIYGLAVGTTACEMQPIGVAGMAKTSSTTGTTYDDATGVYGVGRLTGSATGVGIGGYMHGRTDSAVGSACGLEVNVYNGTGADHFANTTGFPLTQAMWINANGPNKCGAAITISNGFGQQFDTGIEFTAQVTSALTGGIDRYSIRDDSTSDIAHFILGTHTTAAISIAQDSGKVVIGAGAAAGGGYYASTTKVEVSAMNAAYSASAPTMVIYSEGATAVPVLEVASQSGRLQVAAAGAADDVMTGVAAGDAALFNATAGKSVHLGGTTSVIEVTQTNALGFFNDATPATKQEVTGSKGANAALTSLLTALAAYGLITDSSS